MSFNSAEYLLFLPLVLILHGLLEGRENRRHWLLLVASYGFYMGWNWRYAGLIALSTWIDFSVGTRMSRSHSPPLRRLLLVISLGTNLGLLAAFKYWGFLAGNAESLLQLLGFDISLPQHDLLLPVGISFYTFQTLSYTIDLYRRQIDVEPSLTRFALFVSFFPQLVAGPIVRASEFIPQLREQPTVPANQIRRGMARIFRGLIKKIVFADILAVALVDPMFANPGEYGSLDLLLGLYAYAFQIYGDFSGYSDIAIGSALCLGYQLPENFNRPYLSQNVREFWTRWHISLSGWLRDYLYIPLGGNRVGPRRTAINLMVTMGLGGLWHGAAWTYVLWGIYHGLLLMLARSSTRRAGGEQRSKAEVLWHQLVCFHLIVGGWLLFRATSLQNLGDYVTGLLSLRGGLHASPLAIGILALASTAHLAPKDMLDRWQERSVNTTPAWLQGAAYAGLIVFFVGATLDTAAFLYFQF